LEAIRVLSSEQIAIVFSLGYRTSVAKWQPDPPAASITAGSPALWFDHAKQLNGLGLDMLRDREVPRHANQRLTIAILFVGAHKSFHPA
jgi:hypothetical protein